MNNILILSAGRRVGLVKCFQSELKSRVPDGRLLCADLHPQLSAACQSSDGAFRICRPTDAEYPDQLLDLCMAEGVGLVVPTIDTELLTLSRLKQRFLSHGIKIMIADEEFVRQCRDKRLTHQFFIHRGIPVPPYVDRHNPSFPLFVKPIDGSSSANIHLIRDSSMLSPSFVADQNLMFVEAIDVEEFDEYTIDLYYDRDGCLRCVVPRRRLEIRAGEVSKGITIRNEIVQFVREKLERVPGALGCITLQMFKHRVDQRYYGIEINPRFGGGYPLSYLARANYPAWIIEEHLFGRVPDWNGFFDDWEGNLLMLRYDGEVLVQGYVCP